MLRISLIFTALRNSYYHSLHLTSEKSLERVGNSPKVAQEARGGIKPRQADPGATTHAPS